MKMTAAKPLGLTLLVSLLAACGGGGGGDSGLSVSTPYAVGQGYANLLAANRSWTTTGVGSDGRTYTFTLQTQRLADAAFPLTGVTAARVRQTSTVTASSPSPVNSPSTTDSYYSLSTGLLIGTYSPDDGSCSRVTASTALPAQATAGGTGPLTTEAELNGCTSTSAQTATTTSTWSLVAAASANGGAFALLCENASIVGSGTVTSGTAAYCVEIGTDGSLGSRAKLTINVPSLPFSLTATNY